MLKYILEECCTVEEVFFKSFLASSIVYVMYHLLGFIPLSICRCLVRASLYAYILLHLAIFCSRQCSYVFLDLQKNQNMEHTN